MKALSILIVFSILALGYFSGVGKKIKERLESLKSKVPSPVSTEAKKAPTLFGEEVSSTGEAAPVATQEMFLTVDFPKDKATVSTEKILVSGRTLAGAEVFVNEIQVFPDGSGNFQTEVLLYEGENYVLLVAGNEDGEAEVERVVYYEE